MARIPPYSGSILITKLVPAVHLTLVTVPMHMAPFCVPGHMIWTRILRCWKLPEMFMNRGMFFTPGGHEVHRLLLYRVVFIILVGLRKRSILMMIMPTAHLQSTGERRAIHLPGRTGELSGMMAERRAVLQGLLHMM